MIFADKPAILPLDRKPSGSSLSLMRKRRALFATVALFTLAVAWSLLDVKLSAAQIESQEWTPPLELAQFTARSDAPLVAVDQVGVAHLVWGSTLESPDSWLDTVYYQATNGVDWNEPMDVLAAPPGTFAIPQGFQVDPLGNLVLVWLRDRSVCLSVAPATAANNAQSWVTTVIDSNVKTSSAALAVGQDGAYHVLYVIGDFTLLYTRSTDGGTTWAVPITVEDGAARRRAIRNPAILADRTRRIFATWSYTAEETDWGLAGVGFGRSLSGGESWDPVQTIVSDNGYGISELFIDSKNRLAITWIGDLKVGGRYMQWSNDSGETWTNSTTIAPPDQIRGASGAVHILEDSGGHLHALFSGLDMGGDQIWYSNWTGTNWTAPYSLSDQLERSERPSAALGSGRRIHVLWYEYASHHVWYSTADAGTPSSKPETRPTLVSQASLLKLTPAASSTPMPTQQDQGMLTPELPVELEPAPGTFGSDRPQDNVPGAGTLLGATSAALLVLVVFSFRLRRKI